ncbi:DedA family protein [Nocardia brevicatena]|uniref:DedA family protein n=1 Tax=Nocardia brevicatena TaxID=37327 RepID=UPI000316534E|nr:VTT domain-containing protein [Nocardia brevicatena]
MSVLADLVGRVPAAVAYLVVAAVVLTESVLLIGAFVPTLTLLLTAGALVRTGRLDPVAVVMVAATAVAVGDFLGHSTGRFLGARLRTGPLGRRIPRAAWFSAEALMRRRGGRAVLVSRFVPVVRTLTPHLAGAAGLPYRRIASYSVVAALLWAGAEVGACYLAAALRQILAIGAPVLAALAVGVAAVVPILRRWRLGTGPSVSGPDDMRSVPRADARTVEEDLSADDHLMRSSPRRRRAAELPPVEYGPGGIVEDGTQAPIATITVIPDRR